MKRRVLFPSVFLAALAFAAYPRLSAKLHRWQASRQATAAVAPLAITLHEGDLIFHTFQSAQSQAIQLATHSPYSHCGLLYKANGEWQVFEAVQPVKLTPLSSWVARGQGQHFVVKRLRDAATALTPAALAQLWAAGQPLLGRGYDLAFKLVGPADLLLRAYLENVRPGAAPAARPAATATRFRPA